MIEDVLDVISSILLLPLQLLLLPIDAFLSQIDGLEVIPDSIEAITGFVGTIPETVLYLTGINPVLWNATILVFVAYMTASPTINMLKTIWRFVRP